MGQIVSTPPQQVPDQRFYEAMIDARYHYRVKQITNEEIINAKNKLIQECPQKLKEIDQQINKQQDFVVSLEGSYRGQRKSYYREGYGEQISDDQQRYWLGMWSGDKMEGLGCSLFAFNQYYEYYVGNFHAGRANGKGKLTKKNGSYIDGDWVNGEPEGKGTIYITDHSSYEGEISKGMMHGKGKMKFIQSNVICEGKFVEDQMVYGQIDDQAIGRYLGEIKDGKFHGKGYFIWNDGSYYRGEFEENCRHGFGVSKFKDDQNSGNEVWRWVEDKQVDKVSV